MVLYAGVLTNYNSVEKIDQSDICFFRNLQAKGDGGYFPRALALYLFGNEVLFLHVGLFVVASAFVS